MTDLIQTVDPTPYIIVCWITSAIALAAMAFWAWRDREKAKKALGKVNDKQF